MASPQRSPLNAVPKPQIPRVFIDANVILAALVVPMSPARTIVTLACLKKQPYQLVLAEYVRREIEQNLAQHPPELTQLFHQFLGLIRPQTVRLTRPGRWAVANKLRGLFTNLPIRCWTWAFPSSIPRFGMRWSGRLRTLSSGDAGRIHTREPMRMNSGTK